MGVVYALCHLMLFSLRRTWHTSGGRPRRVCALVPPTSRAKAKSNIFCSVGLNTPEFFTFFLRNRSHVSFIEIPSFSFFPPLFLSKGNNLSPPPHRPPPPFCDRPSPLPDQY